MDEAENLSSPDKIVAYKPILECVPERVTVNGNEVSVKLRDEQRDVLLWIEQNYHKHKILIANMPVGAGKSIVAITYAIWIQANQFGKTALLTPTKMLQDQYQDNFPAIPLLKGSGSYRCQHDSTPLEVFEKSRRAIGMSCRNYKTMSMSEPPKYCESGCLYKATFMDCKTANISIYNMHSYYYSKMWKDHAVIDEAHNMAPFLFDMYAIKIWQPEVGYEDKPIYSATEVSDIIGKYLTDLSQQLFIAKDAKDAKLAESIEDEERRYQNVLVALATWGKDVLIVKKTEEYQVSRHLPQAVKNKLKILAKTQQNCIYIKPLKISAFVSNVFWPGEFTKKVLLLSATIGPLDRVELGIKDGDVAYYESGSPIPPERRPFIVWPVASMRSAMQQESLPVATEAILKIAQKHKEQKGLIHATYSLALFLKKVIQNDHPELAHRFMFHDKKDKLDIYDQFRSHKMPMILVGSGMSEGIDLAEDAARWQIICKVMYPSLGDDVHKWRCYNAPALYNWDAVKVIIQQSGRICRGPTDYGITYFIDSDIKFLEQRTPNAWPKWFLQARKEIKV